MNHKVFVISLRDHNEKRRRNVIKQMKRFDIDFEFIDAIDGYQLDLKSDQRLSREAVNMRPGHIGCSLSHLECYKLITERNLDAAVILEDDMKILSDFTVGLSKILNAIKGEKTVCFFYVRTFPGEQLELDKNAYENVNSDLSIYRLMNGRPNCTTAYVISKKAAAELLAHQYPVSTVADDFDRFIKKGLIENVYVAYPEPISISAFESQIAYEPYGRFEKILFALNKIPFFPNLFVKYRTIKTNARDSYLIFK